MIIILDELNISKLMYMISGFKYHILRWSLCAIIFIYITDSVWAIETDSLFKSDEIINLELRSDFSAIQQDRVSTPVFHEGELIYYTPVGESKKLSVQIKVRGHFRLNTANCNFPPLYVHFKKNEVENTLFDNQNKLKLVTPCQNEEYVLKEYIIYKLYNQVTDLSMNARLVKILYFDTSKDKKVFEKYSFFIEEKKRIAERNNVFEKDAFVSPTDLNNENFIRLSIFQYIIGNVDWLNWYYEKYHRYHNVIIMQPVDTALAPLLIPYDFDFAAIVNARYTLPKPRPGVLPDIRRIYRGLCYSAEEFEESFKFYRKLRPEFESIINNMTQVSKNGRKHMIKYIEYFYIIIENKKLIKREFLDGCENSIELTKYI